MSGHGEKLSRQQERAIAALLTQRSIGKAAEKAGVSTRTLKSWLRLPGFADAYRQARREVVEHAIGRVQRATSRAVATLVRLLKCGRPPTEARASVAILTQAVRGVEVVDLIHAVEELRREVEAMKHAPGPSQPDDAASPPQNRSGEAGGPEPDPGGGV